MKYGRLFPSTCEAGRALIFQSSNEQRLSDVLRSFALFLGHFTLLIRGVLVYIVCVIVHSYRSVDFEILLPLFIYPLVCVLNDRCVSTLLLLMAHSSASHVPYLEEVPRLPSTSLFSPRTQLHRALSLPVTLDSSVGAATFPVV